MIEIAIRITKSRAFLDSPHYMIRRFCYRIENILKATSGMLTNTESCAPGGRHDNDFEDFRQITILPTPDEIASTDLPFYRTADYIYTIDPDHRALVHYDNQFRLLREDLLAELRNDLQVARGQKKGKGSAYRIDGLTFCGVACGDHNRRKQCCLTFRCTKGLPFLSGAVSDDHKMLRHQAFGCLLNGADVVVFATVDRSQSVLVDKIPTIALEVTERGALNRLLACTSPGKDFIFLVVNTPVFAYEPVLKQLQEKREFPMAECLLSSHPSPGVLSLSGDVSRVVNRIKESDGKRLEMILGTQREITLDSSQLQSLLAGLEQSVSIIQGPPGIKIICLCTCLVTNVYTRYREVFYRRASHKDLA
jgi:hypothetical protein